MSNHCCGAAMLQTNEHRPQQPSYKDSILRALSGHFLCSLLTMQDKLGVTLLSFQASFRGVSSNLLGTRITRSHDGRKFCPSGLVGRAGSGTRRVRCRLRPRGCPCVYDLSALCFGRMVTGPAPHPQGQHITPKKGLRAASAMPATCST